MGRKGQTKCVCSSGPDRNKFKFLLRWGFWCDKRANSFCSWDSIEIGRKETSLKSILVGMRQFRFSQETYQANSGIIVITNRVWQTSNWWLGSERSKWDNIRGGGKLTVPHCRIDCGIDTTSLEESADRFRELVSIEKRIPLRIGGEGEGGWRRDGIGTKKWRGEKRTRLKSENWLQLNFALIVWVFFYDQ